MMNKILIDGDSLSFYCSRETAQLSIDELESRIQQLFMTTNAESYLIVLSKGNYFRHGIFKDYKMARNQYRDKNKNFAKTLQGYLIDEHGAIHVHGAEADDVAAYIKTKFPDVIVCSPDKDVLQQIPGTHFDYRWKKINSGTIDEQTEEGRWITTSVEEADKFLWTQCLTGDQTDGVKGIPGIGPVTAAKILTHPPYHNIVFDEYIKYYGLSYGMKMFQLNYRLLYLLRTDQDFINENISPISIELDQFTDLSNTTTITEQWSTL